MKKLYKILILVIFLMLAGCERSSLSSGEILSDTVATTDTDALTIDDGEDLEYSKQENVSPEVFMEYYSLTEEQVPLDYVKTYIDEFDITYEDIERWDIGENVLDAYSQGLTYGHNLQKIFDGVESGEPLDEYMKQAEVIQFLFKRTYGEYDYLDYMVIDLKEGKIYFSPATSDDYTTCQLSAELNDDNVNSIREQLPEHIIDADISCDGIYGEYSFEIKMTAADGTTKLYYGSEGDKELFPEFDEYWKELYKTYFGKEYKFEP